MLHCTIAASFFAVFVVVTISLRLSRARGACASLSAETDHDARGVERFGRGQEERTRRNTYLEWTFVARLLLVFSDGGLNAIEQIDRAFQPLVGVVPAQMIRCSNEALVVILDEIRSLGVRTTHGILSIALHRPIVAQ